MSAAPTAGGVAVAVDAGSATPREAEHVGATLLRVLGLPSDGSADLLVCTLPVHDAEPHSAVVLAAAPGIVGEPVAAPELAARLGEALGGPVGVGVGTQSPVGEPRLAAGAAAALEQWRSGLGRVAVFPGFAALPEALPVSDLLRRTAITTVTVLAGGTADPDCVLRTHGFLRPVLRGGSLELLVETGPGGLLVPFEVADPTPCCADH